MPGPTSANMRTCDKKCKCPYGPYENVAYNCEKPCRDEDCSFDCDTGCDCGDSAGCWLIEVARTTGEPNATQPNDVELYQNVPVGWDLGLLTPSVSTPSSGVTRSPAKQTCSEEDVENGTCGADLPSSSWYSQYNGDAEICLSSDLGSNRTVRAGEILVSNNSGGYGPEIAPLQDATGQNQAFCNTDSITMVQDEENFPPNPSSLTNHCRNPFTLWSRIVRVNAYGVNPQTGPYFCGDGTCGAYGLWVDCRVDFVELDFARIQLFYGNSSGVCGYTSRGGFLLDYRVEKRFVRNTSAQRGWSSSFIWQGSLNTNSDPNSAGRSVAVFFGTDELCAKAELYIGQSRPTDYNVIPDDFQLLETRINPDTDINPICLQGW